MFKKKKEVVKTFDAQGKELGHEPELIDLEVPDKIPDLETGCFICQDRRFYKDNTGLWHSCPKCGVR